MSHPSDPKERPCFRDFASALQSGQLSNGWRSSFTTKGSFSDHVGKVIRFHEACTRVMNDSPLAGEPSSKDLEELCNNYPEFPKVVARALCRELRGTHQEEILARSVTQVVLVDENQQGLLMDLHLELIRETTSGGEIYPHPVMLFVETNGEFNQATEHAFAWIKQKKLLPDKCEVRWRLRAQSDGDPWPSRIDGDSAGGAFLFGLLQLLAGNIPASVDQKLGTLLVGLNGHPHSRRGVIWMCTVARGGALSLIGSGVEKFLSVRDKSLPRIHTVVAHGNQKQDFISALNPGGTVDAIRFVFAEDPMDAAQQVLDHLENTWEKLLDYRQEWAKHRNAIPRPWLETQIKNYEGERKARKVSGYLVLDAHSGFGKSAAAANRFGPDSPGVAGHFFGPDGGYDDPEAAVRSIVLQLCCIHRITPPKSTKSTKKTLSTDTKNVFKKAGEHAQADQKIQWVVLDGLDRCSDVDRLFELLPREVPDGLAFFVTTHPWMALPDHLMPSGTKMATTIGLPDRDALDEEVKVYLRGRRGDFNPALGEDVAEVIVGRSGGLIGVARDLLAHSDFPSWRRDPKNRIPNGRGQWQGTIWAKESPLQAIENYRRGLVERTGTMQPLGVQKRLPIAEAYVPMAAALPSSAESSRHGVSTMEGGRYEQPVPVLELFDAEVHDSGPASALLLMGEPGSGKTTATQRFAWALAQGEDLPGLPRDMLPVWLRFQEMDQQRTKPKSLEEFLGQLAEPGVGDALLKSRQPRLWILDGFDEIPSEDRQAAVATWITKWVDSFEKKKNGDRLLLTSRPLGSEKWSRLGLNRLPIFELAPLESEDQRDFVKTYLEHYGSFTHINSQFSSVDEASGHLMEIIQAREAQSAEEQRIARNPMMLSLICFLFADNNLPGDWDELYERFVKELFKRGIERLRHEGAKYGSWKPAGFQLQIAVTILKRIAWHLQQQGDRVSQPLECSGSHGGFCLAEAVEQSIKSLQKRQKSAVPNDPGEFLRLMREHVGIMCWRGGEAGRMGFLHLNIQEWLAASHCAAENEGQRLATLFGEKPEDQREVVRLAVKMRGAQVHSKFHHDLFRGLLKPEVQADQNHDIFLSHLLDMVGVQG
jgi:hypothetical protein